MKNLSLLLSAFFIIASLQPVNAQIWKKIQKKAEKKIEKKAEEKMDEVLNGKKKKDKKSDDKENTPEQYPKENDDKSSKSENDPNVSETNNNTPDIWRNYKFIPGEKVIFFDDMKFEEVGEFPSRWDLVKGGAEIARFNDENVIIGTADYNNRITPLFDEPGYLGDEFTVEFDVYIEGSTVSNFWTKIELFFDSKKTKNSSDSNLKLSFNNGKTTKGFAGNSEFGLEEVPLGEMNTWHHVAMSYYKGKFKLYYDDKRIANLPKLGVIPDIVVIDIKGYASAKKKLNAPIKNVRIAHGGGQMYKRIMAEGKYVTNGILFDSGKAVIKSQSMGVINKVVTVMQENPEWKFQIIGHTDSDGSPESNLTLSQNRAEAVKLAIVKQGIDENRLSILGKGENEPLGSNNTPEEKANNRRVEFIKQ